MSRTMGTAATLLLGMLVSASAIAQDPLRPDVAYFDAGAEFAASHLMWDRATGQVGSLLDLVLDPSKPQAGSQMLTWHGNCTYDEASGSIVLDGESCYARLTSDSCGWEATYEKGFSLALVLRVDADSSEATTLATFSHRPESLSWAGGLEWPAGDIVWTYNNLTRRSTIDYSLEDPNPIPFYPMDVDLTSNGPWMEHNRWQLHVITQSFAQVQYFVAGLGPDFSLFGVPQTAAAQPAVNSGLSALLGVVGCDWDRKAGGCVAGTFLKGSVAALGVYARPLTYTEVRGISDSFQGRGSGTEGPAPTHADMPPMASPPPPGNGLLPSGLVPDLAYFDASARTATPLLKQSGGLVSSLQDQVHPFAQSLEWSGNCKYDSSQAPGAGGSIVLDGESCYARLRHSGLCAHNWDAFELQSAGAEGAFSVALLVRLDHTESTALTTFSRPDGYYNAWEGDVLWTCADVIHRDGYAENDYNDSAMDGQINMPAGRWTLEVISAQPTDAVSSSEWAYHYYRSPMLPGGRVQEVGKFSYVPHITGESIVLGCDWDASKEACFGSFMQGRLAAFLAYSRALSQEDVQALYDAFAARLPTEALSPPPPPAPPAPTPKQYDLKLIGGTTPEQGVLLVWSDGQWWAIKESSFGNDDAEVACRQLGFTTGWKLDNSAVAQGVPYLWTSVECDPAVHKKLDECPHEEVPEDQRNPGSDVWRRDVVVRCGDRVTSETAS